MVRHVCQNHKTPKKDSLVVAYVQLTYNEWNKQRGFAQVKVLFSFGRRERLDTEAIRRLIRGLHRFLGPEGVMRRGRNSEV